MKTKNKNMTPIHSTVIVGYAIFSVLVVSVVLSTISPFGQLFFSPHVKHFNVAITLIALSAGAILPAVLAYFVGDSAITSRRKQTHHFNGVLFGLLAYWLISFFSLFPIPFMPAGRDVASINLRMILANFVPVLGVVLVTLAIAFFYARRHMGNKALIYYKPYWMTLVFLILSSAIGAMIHNIATDSFDAFSIIPLGVIALVGAISYATLRKSHLKRTEKIAWCSVSVTILFVAVFVLAQLISDGMSYIKTAGQSAAIAGAISSIVLALAIWWTYWHFTATGLRRRQQ